MSQAVRVHQKVSEHHPEITEGDVGTENGATPTEDMLDTLAEQWENDT